MSIDGNFSVKQQGLGANNLPLIPYTKMKRGPLLILEIPSLQQRPK